MGNPALLVTEQNLVRQETGHTWAWNDRWFWVAERIAKKAFDMEVIAWDRGKTENLMYNEIPRRSLNELLMSCDVVSIHLRLSDDSKGLISGEKIALMKRNAILINTARGAIVDEQALIIAIQSNNLGGATEYRLFELVLISVTLAALNGKRNDYAAYRMDGGGGI